MFIEVFIEVFIEMLIWVKREERAVTFLKFVLDDFCVGIMLVGMNHQMKTVLLAALLTAPCVACANQVPFEPEDATATGPPADTAGPDTQPTADDLRPDAADCEQVFRLVEPFDYFGVVYIDPEISPDPELLASYRVGDLHPVMYQLRGLFLESCADQVMALNPDIEYGPVDPGQFGEETALSTCREILTDAERAGSLEVELTCED